MGVSRKSELNIALFHLLYILSVSRTWLTFILAMKTESETRIAGIKIRMLERKKSKCVSQEDDSNH